MNPHRDPLSEVLERWVVSPTADPNFRPAVTARLAAARPARDLASYLRSHPALWTAAAALAVSGSAWAGHEAARVRDRADQRFLADTYVTQLDPRVLAGLKP